VLTTDVLYIYPQQFLATYKLFGCFSCGTQKSFHRTSSSDEMVKLTNEYTRWIQKPASSRDFSVKKDSEIHGITEFRVKQQTKSNRDTEEVPAWNQI
jgi:hypothetical protein